MGEALPSRLSQCKHCSEKRGAPLLQQGGGALSHAIRWGVRPDELRISYERRGNRLQRELNEATKAGRAVKTARNLSARLRQLRSSVKRLTQLGGKRTQKTPHLVSKTSPKTLIVLDSAECSPEMQSCVILARILTELGEKSTVVIPEKGALEVVLNTERVPYRIFPIFKEPLAPPMTTRHRQEGTHIRLESQGSSQACKIHRGRAFRYSALHQLRWPLRGISSSRCERSQHFPPSLVNKNRSNE